MNWAGKKVVVTGAAGFIGSHLTEALVRAGAEVRAFVRYTSRGTNGLLALLPDDVRSSVEVVRGDLRDFDGLRSAIAPSSIVFHLGALIAIPYSYRNPADVADVNVRGTLNVLRACLEVGVDRLMHTSTSEVYGTAQVVPIAESHPLQAQSPYSASKIGADALVDSFRRSFGLRTVTVRPFNTYGPRQSGRAVIPTIIGQALFAEAITLGSLEPTRDFLYVTDTAAGFMALAGCDEAVGRTVNLGTGQEISIGQLVERIRAIVGRDVPVIQTSERQRPEKSEVFRLLCDASLARTLTGWSPLVPLHTGLERVVEFIRANPQWTNVNAYEV